MSKLQNYNGRYCESEFESAFLAIWRMKDGITLQETAFPAPPKRMSYIRTISNNFCVRPIPI